MVGSGTTLIESRLLNRNAIGFDVNQNAVNITSERICFEFKGHTKQVVKLGNAQSLSVKDDSIDLIIAHPPYANIVKYSDGKNPDDLSSISSIPNLSRIQYSTWKGVQKAQAGEVDEEWKGLLDWENKKRKTEK
jgi:DNA modification methylase